MIEALILIPVNDNDGTPIDHALHLEIVRRLAACAGGVTTAREVDGLWVGPDGLEYAEAMLPYIVALRSWWQVPTFLAIAEWARDAFEQDAIAVRVVGRWEFWPPS